MALTPLLETPVSASEPVDKVTILKIESERISEPEKAANVDHELIRLAVILDPLLALDLRLQPLKAKLRELNARLWQIENEIRDCKHSRNFGERFIALARSVYRTNDQRIAVKRGTNTLVGSEISEEKSYTAHD